MSAGPPALHVEREGNGPPLLVLHGFGASGFSFRHWVGGLAERHEVLRVDLKGCGRSPKPRDGRYGPHDQAELVHRLVVEEDLRGVAVLGHSMGGSVALLLALRLLEADDAARLSRLVLVASPAYAQGLPRYIGLAHRVPPILGLLALRLVPPRRLARRVLREIVHDEAVVTETMVEGYAAPFREKGCRRALIEGARSIVPPDMDDLVGRYPELGLPALLLWGRHDPVVPLWTAERLAGELPRARLEVLERCGHLPMEERPEASLAAVLGFLAEE